MYTLGQRSKDKLESVHPSLKALVYKMLEVLDITVLCGARTEEEQRELVHKGLSKTMNSKHLIQEDGYSHAIDIAPYPINWDRHNRFYFMAGVAKMAAEELGIEIRWGGDWDSDNDFFDQTFMDLPHIELRGN